jgi:predicted transcriptional regulator
MKYILGSRKVYDRMEKMLMSDIVERLRDKNISVSEVLQDLLTEAADTIERLRERIALTALAGVNEARKARAEALEEAARFCAEGNEVAHGNYFAAAIRALKGGE